MLTTILDFLTTEGSLGVLVLVTLLMGGGAAWVAGRALAANWQPWWHVLVFTLMLGAAVRFIHFAVFGSKLLTLHYYLVDSGVCLLLGVVGFRTMRVRQMVSRYGWINERTGAFSWRRRG